MNNDDVLEANIANIAQNNKVLLDLMKNPCYIQAVNLVAVSTKLKYDSFVMVGFTEEQAFQLTLNNLSNSI